MTYVPVLETMRIILVNEEADGSRTPVATTSVVANNRGQRARISTQFADGIPAESETVPGKGSWKPGEILIQHQMHDGRGKCRLVMSGTVDMDGGLAWVIDSTTVDPEGSKGQENSAPISFNVGAANGLYITAFPDGRINFRKALPEKPGKPRGFMEYKTTVERITKTLAREE